MKIICVYCAAVLSDMAKHTLIVRYYWVDKDEDDFLCGSALNSLPHDARQVRRLLAEAQSYQSTRIGMIDAILKAKREDDQTQQVVYGKI